MGKKIIGIDCSPGLPRPNDLLPQVIAGTGLKVKEVMPFFGAATYEYQLSDKRWKEIRPVIYQRLKELYDKGVIRAAFVHQEDSK